MNSHIKKAIETGRLAILLGAGASRGSSNKSGKELPLGSELAKIIAEEAGYTYNGNTLSSVYNASKKKLGARLDGILEENYKHCNPSKEYTLLSSFPFVRIYTLNIDDSLDKAIRNANIQLLNIKQRCDKITERDQLFKEIDLIKLNGDVHNLTNGFIFSDTEYSSANANIPLWYQELANDFFKYTFLFIGTELKEPLFFHQVERYKNDTKSEEQRSYVLTPIIDPIDRDSLFESNIEHISATLGDFTAWLNAEFKDGLTTIQLLHNSRPELNLQDINDTDEYISIFSNIIAVNRTSFSLQKEKGISKFYEGFKPTWNEIIEGVPAYLKITERVYENLLATAKEKKGNLICLLGAAGCGKTTALKQLAFKLSEETSYPVYYIQGVNLNIGRAIELLEKRNKSRYFIFIDRLKDTARELSEVLKKDKIKNGIIIGAENQRIWSSVDKHHLEEYCHAAHNMSYIDKEDATKILEKIEKYGNWTRLSKMSQTQRVNELLNKSSKQLLIGLIETISGEGYNDIIKRDYENLTVEQRNILTLIGLANLQGVNANENTISRALINLKSNNNVFAIISSMDGTLSFKNGELFGRHRVYFERLFELMINNDELLTIVSAYIKSFTVYEYPIITNISKSEGVIYKHLLNAKTLSRLFRKSEKHVLATYEGFQKSLEREGQYWLHYGLALRFFNHQPEALSKLKIAYDAHPESPQIEHALAQQNIIMAIRSSSDKEAFTYFEKAQEVLLRLDRAGITELDDYPIVALSEGHIKIVDKFKSNEEAKKIAAEYFNKLTKRVEYNQNIRLGNTIEKLKKFYITGRWDKSEEDLESTI